MFLLDKGFSYMLSTDRLSKHYGWLLPGKAPIYEIGAFLLPTIESQNLDKVKINRKMQEVISARPLLIDINGLFYHFILLERHRSSTCRN